MASMRRNVPGRRASMEPKPAFPSKQMLVLGTFSCLVLHQKPLRAEAWAVLLARG
jgi:hypothetical protein